MRFRLLKGRVGGLARFRLRALMIVVVLAALPLGAWAEVEARRARFRRAARYHRSCVLGLIATNGIPGPYLYGYIGITRSGKCLSPVQRRLDWWHLKLHSKYQRAEDYPWLPVAPDPPPPEGDSDG